jgi:signal transduction histidine kinase
MNPSHSLKNRIAGAFLLLAFAVCTFFSLAAYVAVEVAETQLINHRLEKVSGQMIEQYQHHIPSQPVEDNFYVNQEIPPAFRNLSPGLHEVDVNDREITVLVQAIDGDVFVITNDTSDFEFTETLVFIAIGAGFLTSLLAAVILGLASARRIVAPVTALASAVERNDEPSALPSLDTQNEIGMLARAFAARTDQLQQFLSDEKLFTGDVSHELRTPLTIILGGAELLGVQLAAQPEQLAVAERIRRVAEEASERVGALLLLSQSPQALGGTQLSLTHLIEREIERYRQLLAGKPVQIQFNSDINEVWVYARAELVGIAIGNLIRNACQYTEAGTVRVRLSATQLEIVDNGPGLPGYVRARLFERFVRGGDSPHVGSGLGLAIVKRVVDHLGWQIRYEQALGGGSRFILAFSTTTAAAAPHSGNGHSV